MLVCNASMRGAAVAHVSGMQPETVPLDDWVGTRDVVLQPAQRLEVWCSDPEGLPVADCAVGLRSTFISDGVPRLDQAASFDNPAIDGFLAFARTDRSGRAIFDVAADAELFLHVVHADYLPGSDNVRQHQSFPGSAGRVQVVMVPARGIVAQGPVGVAMHAFNFEARPKRFDRTDYAFALRAETALRLRFPHCGAFVVRDADGSTPVMVSVRAFAEDGSLWSTEAPAQRLAEISKPVMLAPATAPTGWIRIELHGPAAEMKGVPLAALGEAPEAWYVASGRDHQLPVGAYRLSQMAPVPGIDDAIDAVSFRVEAGTRQQVQVVPVLMAMEMGRLNVGIHIQEGPAGLAPSLMVRLANGDSFVVVENPPGGLILPAGKHLVTVSASGCDPVSREVEVTSGHVADVALELVPFR
jgi:hypothetical protein